MARAASKPKRQKKEERSGLRFTMIGTGGASVSYVSPQRAETVAAVFCAVTNISQAVAKLPLLVYRRLDRGKERASNHRVYPLLHSTPNGRLTAFEFKEMIAWDLLMRGNFFARKRYSPSGSWTLDPLHPDRVEVSVDSDGSLLYKLTDGNGKIEKLLAEEVLHVRGLGTDGVTGKSVITAGGPTLARVIATRQYATDLIANASTPGGVLQYPHTLSEERKKAIAESWEERHRGGGRRNRVAVLEAGMTWQQVGMSNEDAQLIESEYFGIEEVSRLFNIPPHKLKHLLRSTFSNIEHQSKEFYEDTVLPWCKRIEGAINLCLFEERERSSLFAEFLYDSLLTTDTPTRYQAHNLSLQGGWKSRNEIRQIENLNPVEGLDEYLAPLNMGEAGKDAASENDKGESEEMDDDDDDSPILKSAVDPLIERVIRLVLEPTARRETLALEKVKEPWSLRETQEFYDRQVELAAQPIFRAVQAFSLALGVQEPDFQDVRFLVSSRFETRFERLCATAPVAFVETAHGISELALGATLTEDAREISMWLRKQWEPKTSDDT